MTIDQKKNQLALQKARELLEEGERQRARARLLRNLEDFLGGHSAALFQDEFVHNLSQWIVEEDLQEDRQRALQCIEKLSGYATGEEAVLRERAVMTLSFCAGRLSENVQYDLMVRVSLALIQWLKVETTYLPVCDTVCRQFQQSGLKMLAEGDWRQFDIVMEVLFQIQSGILEKGNVIRGLVARTQDMLAADHVLEELSVVSLHGQGGRQAQAERLLIRLGRRAVIFLLEKLLSSQVKEERLRLIGLIPEAGRVALPVFKQYLTRDLPWYGLRNIVLLISAMGDASHLPLVLPLLKHDDLRVQQQVVECIYQLAGTDQKKYLLPALTMVHDALKADIVAHLGRIGCADECADSFLDLLAQRDTIAADVRDELLGQLCIVLRLAPRQRTLILLRRLVAERAKLVGAGRDTLSIIARRTLQIIEPQLQPQDQADTDDQPEISSSPVEAEQRARLNLRDLDEAIQRLVKEKRIDELTSLIADSAEKAAREKDFVTAEILRDRMLAVNPNALIEVIRLSGIIEEEKSNAINSHHLNLWSDLYDFLDSDSFSALYHCQRFHDYQPEEVLVRQGDINSTLFFINAGQVSLTCKKGRDELFLKRLGPGEIIGVAPFFDVSVWTVTLTAMGAVKAQLLEREAFKGLLSLHPGLESSLMDFCRRSDRIAELLRLSGEDRREEPRFAGELTIANSLLDANGYPSAQRFRGRLEDVSIGGLSLLIRISRKENARLFLGRRIVSLLPLGVNAVRECRGEIVGVSVQDVIDQDYLVHVRFDQPLTAVDLKNVMQQWRK